MKPFKTVDSSDLAFFESVMPGRVFSGESISPDYDHDEMTIYGSYRPEAVLQAFWDWSDVVILLTYLLALALFAALLIPSVIWTVIARSATPMRHKIGMIFSLLLLVVAIANSGVLVLL